MWRYYLFQVAAWLLQRLPVSVSYGAAWLGGWLAYRLAADARAAATANLRHVLGPGAGEAAVQRVVLGAFRTSAYNYVDMFRIPVVLPQALLQRTTVHHPERMLEAVRAGKGVVVCTVHFGNFDLLVQVSQAYGIPVVALVERLQPPALFDLVVSLRNRHGLRLLPVGAGALREVVRTLRAGGVMAMTADRDVTGHGLPTRFFDADAKLPSGPVDLAVATGALLIPTFGVRLPGRRYEIFFEEPLELRREPGPDASAYNRRLLIAVAERMIARHPEQWIVFTPIWEHDVSATDTRGPHGTG